MDIEKKKNFVPADIIIKDRIFMEDDGGKEVLIIKTNKNGLKYSINGEMNFGATKASENEIRFIFSFLRRETDNFVVDLNIPVKKNIEKLKSYLNQKYLYTSFFYYEDNNPYYAFSKSFKIERTQKEEILKMLDPEYPVIHKIDLMDFKLKNIISDKYYSYKLNLKDSKPSRYFLKILKKYSKNKEDITIWFNFDENNYYLFSSKLLKGMNPAEKRKNPLNEGALPFGLVKDKTIFLLIINKDGIDKLAELSGNNGYEKKYNLWN
ncbi:MAG: hypothetical protein FXF47_07800 [Candidatus Mcinerneyibacterium aminivorans]|uniref:Uncharacterized protein n=1 Tax=Candidatus Mcinerneyibacterium aminivorans TaxID=2703815 RepID=A0A5D0ME62_9BACT|nr:MAG: hypothetical protein FXF47_07800 [Candidatus Mcinerneyibacterium aminivorans]